MLLRGGFDYFVVRFGIVFHPLDSPFHLRYAFVNSPWGSIELFGNSVRIQPEILLKDEPVQIAYRGNEGCFSTEIVGIKGFSINLVEMRNSQFYRFPCHSTQI